MASATLLYEPFRIIVEHRQESHFLRLCSIFLCNYPLSSSFPLILFTGQQLLHLGNELQGH